ncbi:MAG: metal-dependent transcriptional regulator [Cyclobacteriaceae bacterium]
MQLSTTEENYIKAIYHLSNGGENAVSTNTIADELSTTAASVSDMIKKLANKELLSYKKYHGVNIGRKGSIAALSIIRKHRLWEVFLVDKLSFNWDEVHEVAEQLEHIDSPLLISRLDEFLEYPKIDPHGDPIPDENGEIKVGPQFPLTDLALDTSAVITAVENTESLFLQHLDNLGIRLGIKFKIIEKAVYDGSLTLELEQEQRVFVSKETAKNLLVRNI